MEASFKVLEAQDLESSLCLKSGHKGAFDLQGGSPTEQDSLSNPVQNTWLEPSLWQHLLSDQLAFSAQLQDLPTEHRICY